MQARLRNLPPVWLALPTLVLGSLLARTPAPGAPPGRPVAPEPIRTRARVPAAPAARATQAARTVPARSPAPPAAAARTPLVAITHPTLHPGKMSGPHLRDLVTGRAGWESLGRPGRKVHLLLDPQAASGAVALWIMEGRRPERVLVRSGRAAVRAVERDLDAFALVPADVVGPGVRTLPLGGVDPLLDPNEYPLVVGGARRGPVVRAIAVGDILLSRTVHRKMAASGDFASPFRSTWQRLAGADLAFANFEGTMKRGASPLPGGTRFVSVPAGTRGLVLAGIDVLSLANNHTGDFGSATLLETIRLIERAGIRTIGAGDEERARAPAIMTRRGVRFGFLAFNAIIGTSPPSASRPGAARVRMAPWFPFSGADLDAFLGSVRALRPKVDVLIVYPHWGQEYTSTPGADQRMVARAIVDAGADMVIATHPHWVQGAEIYRGKLIAYSLGNFVFDQTWSPETQEGAALELVFWGPVLKRAEFVPVGIEDAHRPRFLGSSGLPILRRIWRASGEPFALGAA